MNLSDKFHPDVFKTSGKMTAILGFIFNEVWTEPTIIDMVVTSDRHVLIDYGTERLCGMFELEDNLRGAAKAAGLTPIETGNFNQIINSRIRYLCDTRIIL